MRIKSARGFLYPSVKLHISSCLSLSLVVWVSKGQECLHNCTAYQQKLAWFVRYVFLMSNFSSRSLLNCICTLYTDISKSYCKRPGQTRRDQREFVLNNYLSSMEIDPNVNGHQIISENPMDGCAGFLGRTLRADVSQCGHNVRTRRLLICPRFRRENGTVA